MRLREAVASALHLLVIGSFSALGVFFVFSSIAARLAGRRCEMAIGSAGTFLFGRSVFRRRSPVCSCLVFMGSAEAAFCGC